MSEQIQIEPLGAGDYLVRVRYADGVIESRFRVSQDVLDRFGVPEDRVAEVIDEIAGFLTDRRPLIDLPPLVDLDDVAAAYDDYLEHLGRWVDAR